MTTTELVSVWMEASTGRIELNDARRRNAISPNLSLELAAGVTSVLDGGASSIVLTAAPPVFSSGGSIDELLAPTHALEDAYRGQVALASAPVPTIAVVAAPAVGAGTSLALACDVILAGPGARFDPRFLDVGIHPGGGHLRRLALRVGYQGAAALSLCGDEVTGEEAAAVGLVWRCVPEEQLLDTAMAFAARVGSRPPDLVRRAKESLRRSIELDEASAVALEDEAQRWSMGQSFFAERVAELRDRLGSRSP